MPRPIAIRGGARVALVSPAGPLRGAADLDRAMDNARSLGWTPRASPSVLARLGYFAGDDRARAADLIAALEDPAIDAVWCVRGGYGAMRILDAVDWRAYARHPKPILGYSDVTALLCAAATVGVSGYHAPTARAELTAFSRASLVAAVSGGDPCGAAPGARVVRPGRAAGRLAGGNLALLAALAGTRYAPRLDGALLVIEDVNEAVYRIDRMLHQLLLAGLLDGCRGIVAGQFTNAPEESDDGARTLDDVLGEIADRLSVPCLVGVPVGHVDDQWTLPLGADAELDADALRLDVV